MVDYTRKLVSIVIPAYKEEAKIIEDIETVYNTMCQTRWDFEIIVVVDGFVDNTYEKAKSINYSEVRVYGYEKNRGKGFAVRYGMSLALGNYVAFIDAGADIDPNGISMLLEHMEWYQADAVVGSKRHPVSIVSFNHFMRRVYSWGYHLITSFLFRLSIRDTQTGLKVFKKELLDVVLPRMVIDEFAFDVEILAVARHLGFKRIYEAPVRIKLEFAEKSKIKNSIFLFTDKVVRLMLKDTIALFFRLYFKKFYNDSSNYKWTAHKNFMRLQNIELANIKFSIIIPVRKINDFMEENIKKLKELEYKNFEVIIVVDFEETYDFNGDSRFKIIHVGNKGPGEKRNIGVNYSTGDIVAFLDDDAYPSKRWLNEAKRIFDENNIYALGAPALTPPDVPFLERMSGRILESFLASYSFIYRYLQQKSRFINDFPTVNLFVKKQAFLEVGGFITSFWPGEDTKLCLDLVSKNKKPFLYDPAPVVYHHRRNVFFSHLRQVSRYGQHRGQFARIFPETSRLPFYLVPSFFTLGLFFGPLISSVLPKLWNLYFGVVAVYLLALFIESFRVLLKDKSIKAFCYVCVGIFFTHIIYGLNFLLGYIKKPNLNLREIDLKTGNYIGG